MSTASFQVVYDGPATAGNTLDVRELAPALLAFGDLIEQANLALNGGRATVSVRVRASFKTGSFGIDLAIVQGLLDQMRSLFQEPAVVSAMALTEKLGFVVEKGSTAVLGVLAVLKWLKGRKIKRAVLLDDGNVRLEVDEDRIVIEQQTLTLLRNFKLRQALQLAIAVPLQREGIESVAVTTDPHAGFNVVTKAEGPYFMAPAADTEQLVDEAFQANLQLVSVSFKDDNKWRFTDGTGSFMASVSDPVFAHKVRTSEASFAAGDILKVRLRRRQWLEGEQMKSDYEVIEVLEHRRGMAQLAVPFEDPEPPQRQ